ncbi:hypothetical protein CFC21_003148 [Triticum aestivum]|uniref:Uncharacterized protein n=2 Tax=Triticum TaxID=4564 RepID=A0A9R0V1D3_TRITD|nr:uncharacterized protein At1g05835-like [Triticum aestivum]KAF6985258.1 hypothetical protein CFC21_003148 [Triticum aestivum]VAH08651.1 unnamed protein product [Triticum turgidum subsp. durum]
MEAKLVVILAACLLISFSNGGDAQCTVKDLVVAQTTAPTQPGETYPKHVVTVKNTCVCMQLNVKMDCAGFDSSIDVVPAYTITPDGDNALCTLNGGRPVYGNGTVTFSYAWSTDISFRPVSSYMECSAAP